jgi:DNA segregation ATPase FtsK/SpoIIIE, S-DNA-T family
VAATRKRRGPTATTSRADAARATKGPSKTASSRSGSSGRTTAGKAVRGRSRPPVPRGPFVTPSTLRSVLGIGLLVAGAITLIALVLPADGILNGLVAGFLRPTFGQGAWLLGVLLIVGGVMVERTPRMEPSWLAVAFGGLLVFVGGEGLIHLLSGRGGTADDLAQGAGSIGHGLSSSLTDLVSGFGAFVILVGMVVAGLLLMFELTLRHLLHPVTVGSRAVATATTSAIAGASAARSTRAAERDAAIAASNVGVAAAPTVRGTDPIGRTGRSDRARMAQEPLDLPRPQPSPAPLSLTVWAAGFNDPKGLGAAHAPGGATPAGSAAATAGSIAVVAGAAPRPGTPSSAELAGDPASVRPIAVPREWILPAVDLLTVHRPAAPGSQPDHARNVRIIEEKLRSFQIPAEVVGTNSGPVVTQYEVKPDVRIKLSRIEGLADDLAMALAARTIRIEAPIPGRDVVGIEIPNHSSEVVGIRSLYEDARMGDATSKLTFALGRDVSGKAYAVDLARMPHLLIAGATGSGKSVCVNALITSLLLRATPDEVNLVLVDLKRVELAPYQGLPHLKTEVIVEPHHARAALAWAVGQMEDRYKALAARGERNITAYNASERVEPHERLPYIVVVIDELADLMMREGRKVEDPIVKLAQKARAVGVHLVLATQRPSVNVVTGLIKANVPSRIAFAMASNVDSRTVLDAPGAEDLIGRGDMLYQPADLPRPVRLQGVFVSDAEVHAVVEAWRTQEPEPRYDADVLAAADEEGGEGGQFGWLARMAEDEMTPRAAELVMATGKASTSMMQTKLKVGFNRASRLMEELERFGIVGPQDPRNPATPRQVYGPDNWLRGPESVDDL